VLELLSELLNGPPSAVGQPVTLGRPHCSGLRAECPHDF